MSCPILKLTKRLVQCESISPNDAGCQDILVEDYFKPLDFIIEYLPFEDTQNIWAFHQGKEKGPSLLFVGHTDIVPAGDLSQWNSHPFEASIRNNIIYGRGVADMKGALAAMIIATERFIKNNPLHKGKLAFIITSDEEGKSENGTKKVIHTLIKRNERIDYCLIGEPSSTYKIGDTIKNGRRGSLTANIVIHGIQGHIAYPHLANNPIHSSILFLKELIYHEWDKGNAFFPSTTMQISNIHAGHGNSNIIPGKLHLQINFRFGTQTNELIIRNKVKNILQSHFNKEDYHIDWLFSGPPFLTLPGKLLEVVSQAIQHYQGITPHIETTGGTSDGRFVVQTGSEIVELGLINKTIHKVNECTKITDLQVLAKIYQFIISKILM
ncbi:succinyl-diaminopimelate desuccinylase [Candidatus Schneideria nysicola]|uniref:succinyl-diaminopimelate desuccinylase n=1 Tax=Candidatus Schneideria nysicola TaxID=1081631 RepID=UPI001CAA7C50|nr:succinyl-diaminopimelate desuccinylase [Candidatus Schneideria nysicola]UAJ65763.1 succinyl-diaminopimelate desuccinylase [Candidatus Schneideria nysicola]